MVMRTFRPRKCHGGEIRCMRRVDKRRASCGIGGYRSVTYRTPHLDMGESFGKRGCGGFFVLGVEPKVEKLQVV